MKRRPGGQNANQNRVSWEAGNQVAFIAKTVGEYMITMIQLVLLTTLDYICGLTKSTGIREVEERQTKSSHLLGDGVYRSLGVIRYLNWNDRRVNLHE